MFSLLTGVVNSPGQDQSCIMGRELLCPGWVLVTSLLMEKPKWKLEYCNKVITEPECLVDGKRPTMRLKLSYLIQYKT